MLTTSSIQGLYTGKLVVKTTLLTCRSQDSEPLSWFGKIKFTLISWLQSGYKLVWSPKWVTLPAQCYVFFHSGRISLLAFLYLFSSVMEACLGSEGRGLSLQPIKIWVTKKHEWSFTELYRVQSLHITELVAELLLHFSESLCSYVIRARITRTLIFAALGDFDWVRTHPYFLTTVGISRRWDFGLLPHSCIQVLSQTMSGLPTKAVLFRVHHLTPVSCCHGFC